MSNPAATWDDAGFKKAFRAYLNLRKNVEPKKELKRRAKNIGLRLIKIYKEKGVDLKEIESKVKTLGYRVKIRPKIRAKRRVDPKKWTHKRMVGAELRARKNAKGFTATGWFPPVEKLGGSPRDKGTRTGPRRGKLIEKLSGSNISETLVNQQPGAVHVANKASTHMQNALDAETADMVVYITKKQNEAARRNGL